LWQISPSLFSDPKYTQIVYKKMQLPLIDDFHVHLRQGALMNAVTPTLKSGGCRLAYIMVSLFDLAKLKTTHYYD
jgi:dihydroorotase